MELKLINEQGQSTASVSASDAAFGREYNESLVHQVMTAYMANGRQGTRAHKDRGEVKHSTKKPWRQKGTGRARVGEIRTPIWRKGGTMFGPVPRDYAYQLPRKMFRSALRSALAMKLKDNQLNVVDAFSLDGHKTKAFAKALAGLGLSRKILVVDNQENANLRLAARNLSDVNLIASLQVTPYQVLNSTHVVFSKAAIQAIEEVLKK